MKGRGKIAVFEAHAALYDVWFEKNREVYLAELEVIRALMPSPGSLGLEVGVGSGKFAAPLGVKLGVEPSPQMAARARKLGIEVHEGVAEKLPFDEDRFDFVLMVTTLCFVDDLTQSFREACRVLRPGGSIILGFVDKDSELGRQYEDQRDQSKFYGEATFFSTKEVIEHLQKTGFTQVESKQTLLPGRPTQTILDGFGEGSFVALRAPKGPHPLKRDVRQAAG